MLKVEYIPIADINPYKGNAKMHPQEQVNQIAESIKQFGFADPIGIWGNEIVEGHGRYLAAKKLGLDTVPVIRLDDLTDEQRRAYALIHNQLTMNTENDLDILAGELELIEDIDMDFFGLEMPQLFSMEDIVPVMTEDREDTEYFTVKLTFPRSKKKQILAYLRGNKEEICRDIMEKAESD